MLPDVPTLRVGIGAVVAAGMLCVGAAIGLLKFISVEKTDPSAASPFFNPNPLSYPMEWVGIVTAAVGLVLLLGITVTLGLRAMAAANPSDPAGRARADGAVGQR